MSCSYDMRNAKSLIGAVLLTAVLSLSTFAANTDTAQYLQSISVVVNTAGTTGTGVIVTRTNSAGEHINFVLTAAHVVESLRHDTEPTGKSKKPTTTFDEAKIVTVFVEDGIKVGRSEFDAKVIRYSDSEDGDDIALLEIRKKELQHQHCPLRFNVNRQGRHTAAARRQLPW